MKPLQYRYICSSSILLCATRSLTKALDVSTLSKLFVSNGGEISGPENATVAVVGKCAPNNEPEKPFCLPNALRPEQDKLQAVDNIVYHAWNSKCVTEGKVVDIVKNTKRPW